jgi:hypothetical protein
MCLEQTGEVGKGVQTPDTRQQTREGRQEKTDKTERKRERKREREREREREVRTSRLFSRCALSRQVRLEKVCRPWPSTNNR